MGLEAIASIPGVLSIVATLLSFAELFSICFIWVDGSVYWYIYIDHYGWHLLFAPCVFTVFVFSVFLLFSIIFGRDLVNTYGKQLTLICYGVCMALLFVAGCFIAWYASKASKAKNTTLKPRYIAASIFDWVNFLVYLALFVLTMLFQ
ncbi:unnamed protein product, partial [Mesorhabditis belari]|uniref:MARVEL domain-containing protein n=1 Tax=Mesorhabditis belari TaxID=2138241 RepID=A0AAF3FM57_9BILA